MFMFNRDFRYVHIYICVAIYQDICACSIVHLGNLKLRGLVVRNVRGVKFLHSKV